MKKNREKDYWLKKAERFRSREAAQNRAAAIRMHEHTSHVQVRRTDDDYEVSYSVARWYLEELDRAGIRL